ncbi:SEC-C metal-binding domain-containing protein [Bradyrhizobium canariense]|uniref:SEC-C metal-binding domain-containing protein n=1 Tax=Bradyrhizobium canariense TaxID=255045 RepID=UPI0035E2802F
MKRNAPCTCGSGKKFKHCHGRKGADERNEVLRRRREAEMRGQARQSGMQAARNVASCSGSSLAKWAAHTSLQIASRWSGDSQGAMSACSFTAAAVCSVAPGAVSSATVIAAPPGQRRVPQRLPQSLAANGSPPSGDAPATLVGPARGCYLCRC